MAHPVKTMTRCYSLPDINVRLVNCDTATIRRSAFVGSSDNNGLPTSSISSRYVSPLKFPFLNKRYSSLLSVSSSCSSTVCSDISSLCSFSQDDISSESDTEAENQVNLHWK